MSRARTAALLEEQERVAQRRAEQWLREVKWETTQAERLAAEATSAMRARRANGQGPGELENASGVGRRQGGRGRKTRARHASASCARGARSCSPTAAEERRGWRRGRTSSVASRSCARRSTRHDSPSSTPNRAALTPRQAELARRKRADWHRGSPRPRLSESHAAAELNAVLADGADDREASDRGRAMRRPTRASACASPNSRRASPKSPRWRHACSSSRSASSSLVELAGIGADGLVALQHGSGHCRSNAGRALGGEAIHRSSRRG